VEENKEVSEAQLIDRLKLAKSTVSYRVKSAISGGWLINLETRRGYPARLALTSLQSPRDKSRGFFFLSASRYTVDANLILDDASVAGVKRLGFRAAAGFQLSPWVPDRFHPHAPMSRIDTLKETKRGTGVLCGCGRPARITARGQTLCYKCFDLHLGFLLEPLDAHPILRERIRKLDTIANMRDTAT
jgi:hypothetical protein